MSLPTLRVLVATRIKNLTHQVPVAFAASPLSSTHDLQVDYWSPSAAVEDHEILFGDPAVVAPVIDTRFPKLRWMQSTWAGVNEFLKQTSRRDYTLTRLGGIFNQPIAEYVIGQIIQCERNFDKMLTLQRARQWDQEPFRRQRQLTDLTLCMLGAGSIGQVVLQRAKGMGMNTVALKLDGSPVPGADRVYTDLSSALQAGDFVVNLLPSTPATTGLLSGAVLQQCRKGAVLINVGRGDVIDEGSILHALESGWIARAVLDVFSKEPLPKDSALWTHPGITITPHVAAMTQGADSAGLFVQNLERYMNKEKLLYTVDWDKGY